MPLEPTQMFEPISNPDLERTNFDDYFSIGKEYINLTFARSDALKFGKINNIAFVTTTSSNARMSLHLSCKHGNTLRVKTADKGEPEKKKYHKDTQRSGCPCYIKYGKNPSTGKLMIKERNGLHNHPIPKNSSTYAMYRKQNHKVSEMIMKILNVPFADPVGAVMSVRTQVILILFFIHVYFI